MSPSVYEGLRRGSPFWGSGGGGLVGLGGGFGGVGWLQSSKVLKTPEPGQACFRSTLQEC